MITDEATIRHYENMDAYMDLRELLPEDLYKKLENQLLYVSDEDGSTVPAAVSLETSSLHSDTGIVMNPPYLAVISSTHHTEDVRSAIEYLFRSAGE